MTLGKLQGCLRLKGSHQKCPLNSQTTIDCLGTVFLPPGSGYPGRLRKLVSPSHQEQREIEHAIKKISSLPLPSAPATSRPSQIEGHQETGEEVLPRFQRCLAGILLN